ncbi:L,D-transpeptidase family protein [Rhodobacter maris]|uniref:L,D-transpeptidase-like protein n=1 Tax=Rhodobacter maris TaxID=446682 RepID=A0A285RN72_9RHOB|nr:L,D-transpeptidase family protein [Rhodobacter maris]SOB95169.1 L,D-transpeptidase-like protein [Rhodobacter maris]
MQRRTVFLGLSSLTLLAACGGDSSKFQSYNGPRITQIQIYKAKRRMFLFSGDKVVKRYKIGLGGAPVGAKRFEGDGKTPEGLYYISRRNPNSAYHLSLGVSYPNPDDVAYAEALGRKPGGDIMIHGQAGKNPPGMRDWTAGCIAVTDQEIEEIYAMVGVGTPVFLFP